MLVDVGLLDVRFPAVKARQIGKRHHATSAKVLKGVAGTSVAKRTLILMKNPEIYIGDDEFLASFLIQIARNLLLYQVLRIYCTKARSMVFEQRPWRSANRPTTC